MRVILGWHALVGDRNVKIAHGQIAEQHRERVLAHRALGDWAAWYIWQRQKSTWKALVEVRNPSIEKFGFEHISLGFQTVCQCTKTRDL